MRQDTLYYDGLCGLCRRSIRILSAFDWLGAFQSVDQSGIADSDLPVPRDLALAGIPMRTHDGRVLVGLPAVRRALRRTPLGFLPAVLMHLPGLSHLATLGYNWIAANRRTSACIVPLEHQDAQSHTQSRTQSQAPADQPTVAPKTSP